MAADWAGEQGIIEASQPDLHAWRQCNGSVCGRGFVVSTQPLKWWTLVREHGL